MISRTLLDVLQSPVQNVPSVVITVLEDNIFLNINPEVAFGTGFPSESEYEEFSRVRGLIFDFLPGEAFEGTFVLSFDDSSEREKFLSEFRALLDSEKLGHCESGSHFSVVQFSLVN